MLHTILFVEDKDLILCGSEGQLLLRMLRIPVGEMLRSLIFLCPQQWPVVTHDTFGSEGSKMTLQFLPQSSLILGELQI